MCHIDEMDEAAMFLAEVNGINNEATLIHCIYYTLGAFTLILIFIYYLFYCEIVHRVQEKNEKQTASKSLN